MIDMNKTYTTRDRRPVRLLCVDGPHKEYPVVGFIGNSLCTSEWTSAGASEWTSAGKLTNSEDTGNYDLIEVVPKIVVERWINVIKNANSGFIYTTTHTSKFEAEILKYVSEVCIARAIHFKWVEP